MTDLRAPNFAVTVPTELWEAFALEYSPDFADSWLYGAKIIGDKLLPRTQTAFFKLRGMIHSPRKDKPHIGVGRIMNEFNLSLMKPVPFQDSGQPSAFEEMPHKFVDQPKRRDR